jgi:predicted nucleic acid-binding protein
VIAYVDASALVKRYVRETASEQTIELTARADVVATSVITRAEVAAALSKAARVGLLSEPHARRALRRFAAEWPHLARVPVSDALVARAGDLAWEYALRANVAIQLASGLAWQELLATDVVFATFDRPLWAAARGAGLFAWPESLVPGG